MPQSILEILQRFHAQSHNWNQGKFSIKYLKNFNVHIPQNEFREKDPNDIHQKTKVRLNTLNNG